MTSNNAAYVGTRPGNNLKQVARNSEGVAECGRATAAQYTSSYTEKRVAVKVYSYKYLESNRSGTPEVDTGKGPSY